MDVKLMTARPTPEETAAVDGILGPPRSGWDGGAHTEADFRIARSGADARAQRHLLLPALWGLQDEIGWISPGGMNYVCERLTVPPAEAYGVATFYSLFATTEQAGRVAHVCDDVACRTAGAGELLESLRSALGPEGAGDESTWHSSPCLGMCDRAPAVLYQMAGDTNFTAGPVTAAQIEASLASGVAGSGRASAPQTVGGDETDLRLLRRVGVTRPESLDEYRDNSGYLALPAALEMGPQAVIDEVIASGLLGRGGAAFPTGRKWAAVAAEPAKPRYLICNADESEPGTFKDRLLLDADPFAVIEAMTIAAFAVGASRGYVYIRGEYPETARLLEESLERARNAGLLGAGILGSEHQFDVEVRRGAGAYICGEETALMESIEGKRGEPRQKPPFPNQVGLFGRPTLVNNVETLANIPIILNDGADAYRALGTEQSSGTRLFCLSGSVPRPGIYEVALGTTLGGLFEVAGGVERSEIQAILLGGAAGSFVTSDALDVELSFEGAREAGVTLGSGAVVVFDHSVEMSVIVTRIAAFFRDESCGQCVPCRVGTARQEEVLARAVSNGGAGNGEAILLADIAAAMTDASICGLGQTASSAVQSALKLGLVGGPR